MDKKKPRYVLYYIFLLLFTVFVLRQKCLVEDPGASAFWIILQWAIWVILFAYNFRNLIHRFKSRTAGLQEYIFIAVTVVFVVLHLKALNADARRSFPEICELFGSSSSLVEGGKTGDGMFKIKRPPPWFSTPVGAPADPK